MRTATFAQILTREITRMQAAHPERAHELARAQAFILQGMVLPTDDPTTARVLSSDGLTYYTVNGSCSCQAGAHGKACKHIQAWKLYQYIAKRMPAPVVPDLVEPWPDNDLEALAAPRGAQVPTAPPSEGVGDASGAHSPS